MRDVRIGHESFGFSCDSKDIACSEKLSQTGRHGN